MNKSSGGNHHRRPYQHRQHQRHQCACAVKSAFSASLCTSCTKCGSCSGNAFVTPLLSIAVVITISSILIGIGGITTSTRTISVAAAPTGGGCHPSLSSLSSLVSTNDHSEVLSSSSSVPLPSSNTTYRCVETILFYTGYAYDVWGPSEYGRRALPGSETAVMLLASSLASLGHHVTVAGMVTNGIYAGVTYVSWELLNSRITDTSWFDIVIVVRYIHFWLDYSPPCAIRYIWLHDNEIQPYHNGRSLPARGSPLLRNLWPTIDGVIALTNSHRLTFVGGYPWLAADATATDKIHVIPNALNVLNFSPYRHNNNGGDVGNGGNGVHRGVHRFIYSSRPERGLLTLIQMFAAIRTHLTTAELHIYTYDITDGGDRLATARTLITKLAMNDYIIFHGGVAQCELARAIESSSVWLYPSHFLEAHSITALEMQLGGVLIIVPNVGSMWDTIGDRGMILDVKRLPADYNDNDAHMYTNYWRRYDHHNPSIEPESLRAAHWSFSLPAPEMDATAAAATISSVAWQRYAIEQVVSLIHDHRRVDDYTRRAVTWAQTQTWTHRALQWMQLPQWCSIPSHPSV